MGPKTTELPLSIVRKMIDDCLQTLHELRPGIGDNSTELQKIEAVGEEMEKKGNSLKKTTLKTIYYDFKRAVSKGEMMVTISIGVIKKIEEFTTITYYQEPEKSDLNDTSWFFYHYHKERDQTTGQKKPGILRGRVDFMDKNRVKLYSIFKNIDHRYQGFYQVINKSILSLRLKLLPNDEQNLQIMLHLSDGKINETSVGVFQNITNTNAIVSGTIILNQIPENQTSLEPKFLPTDAPDNETPPAISKFLNTKESNLLKVQPVVANLRDLDRLMEDYNRNNHERRVNPTKKEFQLFISAPSTFSTPLEPGQKTVVNADYGKVTSDVNEIQAAIKKNISNFNEIFCLVSSNNLTHAKYDQIKLYDEMVKGIEKSERYLMIYHDVLSDPHSHPVKQSGIMLELGMALQSQKPCYLLYRNGVELPKFVKAAANKQLIKKCSYESIENLINAEPEFWQWFFKWDAI